MREFQSAQLQGLGGAEVYRAQDASCEFLFEQGAKASYNPTNQDTLLTLNPDPQKNSRRLYFVFDSDNAARYAGKISFEIKGVEVFSLPYGRLSANDDGNVYINEAISFTPTNKGAAKPFQDFISFVHATGAYMMPAINLQIVCDRVKMIAYPRSALSSVVYAMGLLSQNY